MIHGENNWTSNQPSSVIALSVSAHHNASLEMLNQFNATVKVGKAYKVPSIGVLFRHEIALAGGITEDNLMMQIRMFTELYYDFLMSVDETPTEKLEQH